jgi:hypothetical protein
MKHGYRHHPSIAHNVPPTITIPSANSHSSIPVPTLPSTAHAVEIDTSIQNQHTFTDILPTSPIPPAIMTFHDMHAQLAKNIISFFLTARDLYALPHSTARNLTESLMAIIHNFALNFEQVQALSSASVGVDLLFQLQLNSILSENSIHSVLMNQYHFVAPIQHEFSNSSHKLYYVPLTESLSTVCQNEQLRHYLLHPSSNSFFSSPYFLQKIQPLAQQAIYISLYTDEFEVANPIGVSRKKHKLVAVYYSILNFPPNVNSRVDNIFLLCLGKQTLLNDIGIHTFFEPLVNELEELFYHCMVISESVCLPVIACFMSGDNLSMHNIMGLNRCFSSGHICRFCTVQFHALSTNPHDSQLRSHVTYAIDSANRSSGINMPSPFSMVSYVDMPDFFPPDLMHDFLEGVSHVVLCTALRHLCAEIGLEVVNSRLKSFDFGFALPNITRQHITKSHVPLTASQTLHVVLHFPLLFGNVVTDSPEPELFWELLMLHHELLCIFLSDSVSTTPIDYTKLLVKRHHELVYILNQNNPRAKCKIHFIQHYPRFFVMYNGLKHCWTMRYESRHQYFKQIARTLGQFKNIAFTCAQRFQVRSCLLLETASASPSFSPSFVTHTIIGDFLSYEELTALSDFLCEPTLDISTPCSTATSVAVNGFNFSTKRRMVMMYARGAVENEPLFCIIERIICVHDDWLSICYPVESFFDQHFRSYVLEKRSPTPMVVRLKEHSSKPLLVHVVRCCQCVVSSECPN